MTRLGRAARPDAATAGDARAWTPGGGGCWAVGTAGPGSPGASTLALAVAVQARALLVEADPDGGVLGARSGSYLHQNAPSLSSLLVALTSGLDGEAFHETTQLLPSGIHAALLAPAAEDALGPTRHLPGALPALRAALSDLSTHSLSTNSSAAARQAPAHEGRIVLDVGRIRPGSPAAELVGQVDATLVVTGPDVDALSCLLARLPTLINATPTIVVAVRGTGPYPLSDIRAEIHTRAGAAVAVLPVPEDPRGVRSLLAGQPRPGRRRRTRPAATLAAAAETCLDILSLLTPAHPFPTPSTDARRDVQHGVPDGQWAGRT